MKIGDPFPLRMIMKVKMIHDMIALAVMILFLNQAWAADWILYEKSTTGDEYYDQNRVNKVKNNTNSVVIKKIYNDVGKVQNYSALKKINKAPVNPYILSHEIALWEIDCLNGKMRISSERIYDKRGEFIAFKPFSHDTWIDIVPNSKFEKIKNKVCQPVHHSKIKKK